MQTTKIENIEITWLEEAGTIWYRSKEVCKLLEVILDDFDTELFHKGFKRMDDGVYIADTVVTGLCDGRYKNGYIQRKLVLQLLRIYNA